MSKATGARQRIIAAARNSILEKGFGATSIDELIAEAEITKSGFFYHFKDKGELARVLLEEYIEEEEVLFDQIFDQGKDLADDPLQAFLISLKLLARMVEDLPTGHPGCLIATYCYQERLFDREVRDLNRKAVLAWRARFRATLDEIAERYPPKEEIDLDALADMVSTVLEGGIVMSKALAKPRVLSEQVLLFRNLLKAMFLPEAQLSRPAASA
ncbi:TetR/AcrR family transcriptional regulator [Roseibium sp. Sym1]|uniref:TetR/AcrR family transcriptional regulator n=1 Tax=Roseibium sp. Sym1 TaxID=3016006 RepID=UPI0022B4D34E|nr:TetR/AcrR family transcriptional regulator [Roseibium sp. Sym1]